MTIKMGSEGAMWFGDIPAYWDIRRIGNLYNERKTKVSDKDYPPLSVTMQGILPQLETAAKTDAHDDRKLIKKGDFVINSRSDRRGSCGISPTDGSCSLINTVLEPRGEMNPEYYNWFFHTVRFGEEFYRWGHGIHDDLWTTNYSEMKRIFIPVPPIAEQITIAKFLNNKCAAIDEAIERHKKAIEKLEEYRAAQIAYHVAFCGDHETYLTGNTWFAELPVEMGISRIGRHFNVTLGKMLCPKQRDEDDTLEQYYCAADVHFDGINYTDLKQMWFSTQEKKVYAVENGDLLIVEGGAGAGGSYIVSNQTVPTYIQNSILRIRGSKTGSVRYLRYLIEYLVVNGYIPYACNTATFSHFTKDKVSWTPFPVASIESQEHVANILDKMDNDVRTAEKRHKEIISKIEEYRKSLIYHAVTGKIDCRGADAS